MSSNILARPPYLGVKSAMALVALAGIAIAPHLTAMILSVAVDGPDSKWHYHWVRQFAAALSEGIWYPRWAAYDHLGLGDPAFLYLHPLFYYVSALLTIVLGDAWSAMFAAGAIASIASAFLLFWLLKERLGSNIAFVCASLSALSPYAYHLSHYQQFLPMHFAFPALIAFLLTSIAPFSSRRHLATAAALGVLVLSHVLVAFMALIATAPMFLLQVARVEDGRIRVLASHSLAVLLGLGISAIYLYPALTGQSLVTSAAWFEPVHLDWRNSFIFQCFTLPAFGFKWFHLQWTIAFIPAALLAFSLAVVLAFRTEKSATWWTCADFCLLSLTAMLLGYEISYPVWEASETLRKLEFPFRMLIVATISAITAFGFTCAILRSFNYRRLLFISSAVGIAASVAMLSGLTYRFTNEAITTEKVATPSRAVSGLKVAMPVTATEASYHYLRSGGLKGECEARSLTCRETLSATHHRKWEIVSAAEVSNVRLPLVWFPGWQIRSNGRDLPPSWDRGTGLVMVSVASGNNEVEVVWRGIPAERVGLSISVASLIFATLVLFLRRSRSG